MFMETIDTIEPYCPKLATDTKMQFSINGTTVEISGKAYLSAVCSYFVSLAYRNSWTELENWVNLHSFDDIIRFGDEKVNEVALAVSYDTIAFMKKIGYEVDAELLETKFSEIFDMRYFWNAIYTAAMQFNDLKDELAVARKKMKTPRTSQWVGGGFGIGGAVKGMLTAELLNAGGNVVHGVGNEIRSQMRKVYDNHQIKKAKEEVKRSPEFIAGIQKDWTKHMQNLYSYLKSIIKEIGKDLDGKYYFIDLDSSYSYSKCTYQEAICLLKKNIYDMNGYMNLYRENRKLGKSLYEIASFLGFGNELSENWVTYVDCNIIRKLEIKDLGFGMPEDELRARVQEIKDLEDNNPIYESESELKLVQKEQEYSKKLSQICQDFDIKL